ncbi:hypothetical protein COV49_03610 [Candidatus Falkowbacteria bacterium CG11_big_fil_rev_8_21_14_0_20_39_10]|uniref:Uncharacterized protein n=1 Tax=Candidatus Falkowbacteria bacterium CG11_big_fil_rev_8_21_14_0_20_39_10 TaxID=1974570 RepID=A0A2M6K8R3_9BACT|nr:MAG: hypothetical protein COV49_03610 [Candidatus Falkowbacteria bacterium CG11_big_fil_rev_8_21_14_0_20_39_10]
MLKNLRKTRGSILLAMLIAVMIIAVLYYGVRFWGAKEKPGQVEKLQEVRQAANEFGQQYNELQKQRQEEMEEQGL